MKTIDEKLLQDLEFFAGYAQMVTATEQGSTSSFQKLVFLVRDFDYPDYEYGHHELTTERSSNFCKDTFLPSADKCPPENIAVRQKILKNYAKDVGVFLLPYPGLTFVRNAKEKPDEMFSSGVRDFMSVMNSPGHLVTKKVRGLEVSGKDFCVYIQQ